VGISVVNALSVRVEVEIDRAGTRHRMSFVDGGHLEESLHEIGPSPAAPNGTTVRFWPDKKIFEEIAFSSRTLLERFQMMAFLNKGLTIRFHDRRESDDAESVVYFYEGGIRDFVRHVNASKEALFNAVGYFQDSDNGQEVEIAFQWNTGYQSDGIHSFANGINTVEGGMHEEGFRTALTLAINNYIFDKGKLKEKDDRLLGEDIREGLTAIISVRLRDPQFEGQTKGKLGNVSVRTLVQQATYEKLNEWLEENPKRPTPSRPRRSTRRAPAPKPRRPVISSGASRRSMARGCRTSSRTATAVIHTNARSSSSKVIRPVVRPCAPATHACRRSCPSGARSSTSSGPASTRCCAMPRSRR
jgi:DNA gyrase subunit B